MTIEVREYLDPRLFKQALFPFLLREEAVNNLALSITETLLTDPQRYPRFFLRGLFEKGLPCGAALMTPPFGLILTELNSDAQQALLPELIASYPKLPSVVAPVSTAEAFRDAWSLRTGTIVRDSMVQRIYQAEKIVPAPQVEGQMRAASAEDLDLLERWNREFAIDCGMSGELAQVRAQAEAAIHTRSRYLWMLEGEPVCMVGVAGHTPQGARVGYAYTPRQKRRKGYASMLVGELSRQLLREGKKYCFLYTDLANPTSNSIYQKLGYRPVGDSVSFDFSI